MFNIFVLQVEIPLIAAKATNFYKQVVETKDVTKSLTVLSTTLSGLKLELNHFKAIWKKYSEVVSTYKGNKVINHFARCGRSTETTTY